MKLPRFLSVVAALAAVTAMAGNSASAERLEASFLLGLGRGPDATERAAWQARPEQPLADLVAQQKERLNADAVERRAVFARAWFDAHGCAPTAEEAAAAPVTGQTYVELVERARTELTAKPEAYRKVLDYAYRSVVGRPPFTEELDFWKARPTLSYVLVVGCLENWARRNAPGLMVTSGQPTICVTSDRLTTLQLTPAVAAEAHLVAGLLPLGERSLGLARGCNVISPGADNIVSVGGVHFIAVGGNRPAVQ